MDTVEYKIFIRHIFNLFFINKKIAIIIGKLVIIIIVIVYSFFIAEKLSTIRLHLNLYESQQLASLIIEALEQYKNDFGKYPEILNNLCPNYLKSLPVPRVGPNKEFKYTLIGDEYTLSYDTPLDTRRTYDSKIRKWIITD